MFTWLSDVVSWEAMTAISTLAASATIVVTAVFAVMQLNEMKRTRKLQAFMRLFDDLSSPKAREGRLYIYTRLPKDPSQLTNEHFLKIDEVLSGLDRAWILIQERQVEARFVFDAYGEVFLKLWGVLHPIVLYERKRRGGYYRDRAEKLIEQTRKYLAKNRRPVDYELHDYPKEGDTRRINR